MGNVALYIKLKLNNLLAGDKLEVKLAKPSFTNCCKSKQNYRLYIWSI